MEQLEHIKKEALKERLIDIRLKEYFNKMKTVVGYEYTYLTLSTDESIKKSLMTFSKHFDKFDENTIALALLRSSVLSNEKNPTNDIVREYIAEDRLEDLVTAVHCNFAFRKSLTKIYMNHSKETNEETYSKGNDNNNKIGDLLSLIYFEQYLKREKANKKGSK